MKRTQKRPTRSPCTRYLSFVTVFNTSASRSGVSPARNFSCRSFGCALNHASVSRAVTANGRKVSPLSSAALMLTAPDPAVLATSAAPRPACPTRARPSPSPRNPPAPR